MNDVFVGLVVVAVLLTLSIVWNVRLHKSNKLLTKRLEPILDIDTELKKLDETKTAEVETIEKLKKDYKDKLSIYKSLVQTIAIYDEEIELAEWGLYKPHFDFGTSEKFKEAIKQVKAQQREMVQNKEAIYCNTAWVLEGKRSEGIKMTNRSIRLTARSFNSECDAAIANTRWNNVLTMEKRIRKAFETINQLNASNDIHISNRYLELKLKELRLTHEYHEKKQAEKDRLSEIRRQEREEKKLQEELEKAIKEEQTYDSLLKKAKEQAARATGERLSELNAKIEQLQADLTIAHEKSERAKSMAEQTKRGHIYVISNIGSFGTNVYKIGMTRRLDPEERVRELGDASVPFGFDIHALVFTENAPELEGKLHKAFEDRRLNLVNTRREFFHAELSEIREKVEELIPSAEFVETVEARQYKESELLRARRQKRITEDAMSAYPEMI